MDRIDDKYEIRRRVADFFNEVKRESKPSKCIICGEQQTSFCNSHLIPQMVLREIAQDGKILNPAALMDLRFVDEMKGINNSGTFHYICRKCDSRIFSAYEDYNALLERDVTDIMLAQIALKNMLLQLSKRNEEAMHYKKEESSFINKTVLDATVELDVRDYSNDMYEYLSIINGEKTNCFNVIIHEILPYKTPIACQTPVTIYEDLEGAIINETFNLDPNIRMQSAHICVFPIRDRTVVLFFYHKRDKVYRSLRHQFNSMSLDKKLSYLNYYIIKYTENYYLSPNIKRRIGEDKKIKLLSRENNGAPNLGFVSPLNSGKPYQGVKADEISNLLSAEWAI